MHSLFKFILFFISLQQVLSAPSWVGSNLYYVAGLNSTQQQELFSGLKSAGIKVLRVLLDGQQSSEKGTDIDLFPSLEPNIIGHYNYTVLERLDAVMVAAASYNVKLSISIHSFNALEGGDPYGQLYGTTNFYTNGSAIASFQDMISHVLEHVNPHNGKPWRQCSEYIFAFEAQNEAMNNKDMSFISEHAEWKCTMAKSIRENLRGNHSILITTGGHGWLEVSMQDAYFNCSALDILAVHAYGPSDYQTDRLSAYVQKAQAHNKKLLMQEWGACYYDSENNACDYSTPLDEPPRAANLKNWARNISMAGIPWIYWEIIPNADPHWDYDYEIGITDGANWDDFTSAVSISSHYPAAFDYSPWLLY